MIFILQAHCQLLVKEVSMAKAPATSKRSASAPHVKPVEPAGQPLQATQEQITYASILGNGRKVGLAGIVIAFIVYVSGLLGPKVPLENLSQFWTLSSDKYLAAAGIGRGWAWLGMYNYGDMLNYFGIAVLGLISVICYIALIPQLLRKKDFTYVGIAILEVLVLALAASGIIHVGE